MNPRTLTPEEKGLRDVSPDFVYRASDARIARLIVRHENSPKQIHVFDEHRQKLSTYAYWFLLGTIWVSYTGFSDLALWRSLFASKRKNRASSLMKPSELALLEAAPEVIRAYRAHRPDEEDWIAYTVNIRTAARFAHERGIDRVAAYDLDKADVIAFFTRRGEAEILMLDPGKARFVKWISIPPNGTDAEAVP